MLTKEQVAALTEEDWRGWPNERLVALYNDLTGKRASRFSSRAAGEKQVRVAIARVKTAAEVAPTRSSSSTVSPTQVETRNNQPTSNSPIPPVVIHSNVRSITVRTVRGSAGQRIGRPAINFLIRLTESKRQSSPHKDSLRDQLINYLRAAPKQAATIEAIEIHFGRQMRGVVRKLEEKDWLERESALAQAPTAPAGSVPLSAAAA